MPYDPILGPMAGTATADDDEEADLLRQHSLAAMRLASDMDSQQIKHLITTTSQMAALRRKNAAKAVAEAAKKEKDGQKAQAETDKQMDAVAKAPAGMRPMIDLSGAAGPAGAMGDAMGDMGLIRGADGNLRQRNPQYDMGYMSPAIAPVPGQRALRAMEASPPSGVIVPRNISDRNYELAQEAGQRAAAYLKAPLPGDEGYVGEPALPASGPGVVIPTAPPLPDIAGMRSRIEGEEAAQVIQGINDPASVAARMGSMPQQAMGDSWAREVPVSSAGPIPPDVEAVNQDVIGPNRAGAIAPTAGIAPRQMMARPGGEFNEPSITVPGTSIEKVGEGPAERYVSEPSSVKRGVRIDPATGRAIYEAPDVRKAGYGTTFDMATGKATTPAAGLARRNEEIAAAKAETAAREAAAVAARPQPPTPADKLATVIAADDANLARVTTPHRRVQAEHTLARKKDSLLGMGMSQVRKAKTPEEAEALGDKLANDWATPLGSASRQLAEYGTKRARELDMDLGITAATKGYAQFETDMAGAEKSHRAKWTELAHSYMTQENRQREAAALVEAQAQSVATGVKPTKVTFTPMTLDEAYKATQGAAEGYRVGATPAGDVLPDLQVKALKRAGLTDEEALALSEAAVDMGATAKERRRAQQFVLATKRSPRIDLAGIKDFLKKRQMAVATAPAVANPKSAATPADAAEIIRQGQGTPAPAVQPVAAVPAAAAATAPAEDPRIAELIVLAPKSKTARDVLDAKGIQWRK